MERKLFDIRCPGQVLDKTKNKWVKCNKLCVKVYPGSSGEVQCRSCKLRFNFYLDSQANSLLSVRAKPVSTNNGKNDES